MQRGLRLRPGDDGQLGVHGQHDPAKATQLVDDLRSGAEVRSTRGPRIVTWRQAERVLAGYPDGLVDEGPAAGPASLVGLASPASGWTAPDGDGSKPAEPIESDASNHAESAAVEESSSSDETAAEKDEAK